MRLSIEQICFQSLTATFQLKSLLKDKTDSKVGWISAPKKLIAFYCYSKWEELFLNQVEVQVDLNMRHWNHILFWAGTKRLYIIGWMCFQMLQFFQRWSPPNCWTSFTSLSRAVVNPPTPMMISFARDSSPITLSSFSRRKKYMPVITFWAKFPRISSNYNFTFVARTTKRSVSEKLWIHRCSENVNYNCHYGYTVGIWNPT